MPNLGKASRGCLFCRQRKVKCDRKPDGCSNCDRFRYECPGYPDESTLIFRSENNVAQKHVEKRVTAQKQRRSPSEAKQSVTSSNWDEDGTILIRTDRAHRSSHEMKSAPLAVIPAPLAANIDEHALAFFSTNFLMAGSAGDTIPNKIATKSGRRVLEAALDGAMKALALASMSTFTKGSAIAIEARQRYVTAVCKTNEALRCPDLACDDHLLSTILILNAFEAVGGPDAQSLHDWSNHAYGAASLVRLRGMKQFESRVGHVLFLSAVSLVLAAVMRDDTPLPDGLLPLARRARRDIIYFPEYWDYFLIKLELIQFFAPHIDYWPVPKDSLDPEIAIAKALEYDDAILKLIDRLPPFYNYISVYVPDLEMYTLDGNCDVYPHFATAQWWNDIRIHRMTLHAIIRHSLNRISDNDARVSTSRKARELQAMVSHDVAFQMQSEILRSVPQHLGKISYERDAPKQRRDETPVFNFPWTAFKAFLYDPAAMMLPLYKETPVPRSYGGYTLNWALFTAGKVEGTSPVVTMKIQRLLKLIGMPQGNRQAHVMAELTEHEPQWF